MSIYEAMYLDEQWRGIAVAGLIYGAARALERCQLIAHLDEWKAFVLAPKFDPDDRYFEIGETYLIDAVLMLAAIESLLKALLIDGEFVVHMITKSQLKQKQQNYPVPINELLSFRTSTALEIKSQVNFERTLNFSVCLKESYLSGISLPKEISELGKWLQGVRNQVHFLYGNNQCFSPTTLCAQIDELLRYFRQSAFPKMNGIARKYSLNQNYQKSDFEFQQLKLG